jgi:hypothetical protein
MFYQGQFIGNAQQASFGIWVACYLNGEQRTFAHGLKNKGAAKRWLIQQHEKHNVSVEAA